MKKTTTRKLGIVAVAVSGGLLTILLVKKPQGSLRQIIQAVKEKKVTEVFRSSDETQKPVARVAAEDAQPDPTNPYYVIFSKYPELKKSEHFNSIVLESEKSKAEKYAFFTDKHMIEDNFQKLFDPQTANFGDWTPLERVFRVDFIKQAAQIKDNPHRAYIKDNLIQGITGFPEEYKQISQANKKSMVADKIELYFILLKHFPESVAEFNSKATDEKTKKIIAYARQNVELLSEIDLTK